MFRLLSVKLGRHLAEEELNVLLGVAVVSEPFDISVVASSVMVVSLGVGIVVVVVVLRWEGFLL